MIAAALLQIGVILRGGRHRRIHSPVLLLGIIWLQGGRWLRRWPCCLQPREMAALASAVNCANILYHDRFRRTAGASGLYALAQCEDRVAETVLRDATRS